MTEEGLKGLRAPFPETSIGKLPRLTCQDCTSRDACSRHTKRRCDECRQFITEAHIHIDYVGHAETTDRLLTVDPEWNWEPVAFDEQGLPRFDRRDGHPVGLWIRLTVCGLTRLGYGSVKPNTFEAEKQLIGDALRNAAMRFGVALDLWAKTELESQLEEPAPPRSQPSLPEGWESPDQIRSAGARLADLTNQLSDSQKEQLTEFKTELGVGQWPWPHDDWQQVYEQALAILGEPTF